MPWAVRSMEGLAPFIGDESQVFSVLPPDLHARAMEEPEKVVAVPDPKVFVDHSRLVLEEDILVSAEQADSKIDKLREIVFWQGFRKAAPVPLTATPLA